MTVVVMGAMISLFLLPRKVTLIDNILYAALRPCHHCFMLL